MALTLIIEDGSGKADANSYATAAEGDAYHEGHVDAGVWTAATTSAKEQALVHSTRTLDAMVIDWKGTRGSCTQALAWPRDGARLDGCAVPHDIVPAAVKNATIELARLLLSSDITGDIDQNLVKSINLGKGALEIEFKDNRDKSRIPTNINELLMGLGRLPSAGGITQRRVRRI
jgi:hypothetical protein